MVNIEIEYTSTFGNMYLLGKMRKFHIIYICLDITELAICLCVHFIICCIVSLF